MNFSRLTILSFFLFGIFFITSRSTLTAQTMPEQGLCAHRGEQAAAPENTIPAFIAAARAGAHQIEFDVQKTKDGKLVLMHDLTVSRTTNGKGKVEDLTFTEIRALEVNNKKGTQFKGIQVPTLEEALDALPRNIWINVHVKPGNGIAEDSIRVIMAKKRTGQAFLACRKKEMDAVRKICPEALICCMERQATTSDYVKNTIKWKCDFIQLTGKYTKEDIAALKAAGVRINYFGTNDSPKKIRQLLEDGVQFPLVDRFKTTWPVAEKFGLKLNPIEK